MKGTIAQFDTSLLPKVSRRELEFRKYFSRFHVDRDAFALFLSDLFLKSEIESLKKISLDFESATLDRSVVTLSLFDSTRLCVFGTLTEMAIPCALAIPKSAAKELVYALLGNESSVPEDEDLTSLEEGIFSFLVSTLLIALKEKLSEDLGLSIRFGPLNNSSSVQDIFADESHLIDFSFRLQGTQSRSFVQILIGAHPALASLFQNPFRDEEIRLGLERAQGATIKLATVVGEIDINASELQSLQVDDIVIMDKTSVVKKEGVVSGHAQAILGDPAFEVLNAQITLSETGRYRLQIANV